MILALYLIQCLERFTVFKASPINILATLILLSFIICPCPCHDLTPPNPSLWVHAYASTLLSCASNLYRFEGSLSCRNEVPPKMDMCWIRRAHTIANGVSVNASGNASTAARKGSMLNCSLEIQYEVVVETSETMPLSLSRL